jgi:hypothetical protein
LDFKDFHNGLLSLALTLLIFSATLVIGSIVLKPYTNISIQERDFIILLCSVNFIFGLYYLWEVSMFEKNFKLENKNIIKFGKRIGLITLFYLPHLILMLLLFFRDLHNLELLLVLLIFIIEMLIIGLVLKESYDLLFIEKTRRDFEIEENRKKYLESV